MRLQSWARRALLGIAAILGFLVVLVGVGVWFVRSHSVPQTSLESDKGQALLRRNTSPDYEPLAGHWVQQEQMLCCAASAVSVMNSVQPEAGYTQENLFLPGTAQIITLDEFRQGQCTLEKLAALIRARAGLSAACNHAGSGPGESDLSTFRQALKENSATDGDYMILNYSLMYLAGLGEGGGHCSPMAAYDEEEDLVLVLDPRSANRRFWIAAASLYGAMNTVDEISHEHRGWVTVAK
jgi:hypothetical protein